MNCRIIFTTAVVLGLPLLVFGQRVKPAEDDSPWPKEQAYRPTDASDVTRYKGYRLVWHDEFEGKGRPGKDWTYETGFVRNEELQYYQPDNATVHDGVLESCSTISLKMPRCTMACSTSKDASSG